MTEAENQAWDEENGSETKRWWGCWIDLDEDDEVKRLEAQAFIRKRSREAKAWKEQSVSEQLTFEKETSVQEDIPAREQVISEYEKWRADEMRKATEEYYTTAFQSLNELQGFEVDINGETVLLDVDDALKSTIKQSLDTTTIVKQFFLMKKVNW